MHDEADAAVPALLNLGLAVSRRLRARVLVVGDADLSYATALAKQLGDLATACATQMATPRMPFKKFTMKNLSPWTLNFLSQFG